MDIVLSNTVNYVNYLIDNGHPILPHTDPILTGYLNQIIHEKNFKVKPNLASDTRRIFTAVPPNVPEIKKLFADYKLEYDAIDTGVLTIFSGADMKTGLTTFIVNHDVTNRFAIPPEFQKYNFKKIGEYIEVMWDDFLTSEIIEDFKRSKYPEIKKYQPRPLKKGGLVIRNIFKSVEDLLGYMEDQEQYKFSHELLKQKDDLMSVLSDYDVTLVYGNELNDKYKKFTEKGMEKEFSDTIDNTLKEVQNTIVNDISQLTVVGGKSKIQTMIQFIMDNIPNSNITLEKIVGSEKFQKMPKSLKKTDVYTYNSESKAMYKYTIEYSDKNKINFEFMVKQKMKKFFDEKKRIVSPTGEIVKLPLAFTYSPIINKPPKEGSFELVRIFIKFLMKEGSLTPVYQHMFDINTGTLVEEEYDYVSEFLDVSIDKIPKTVVKESDIERNNKSLELSFSSIILDNYQMLVEGLQPNKAGKRCKRLNVIFSIYNLIYTLKRIGKLKKDININTDWVEKYSEKDRIDMFCNLIKVCFGWSPNDQQDKDCSNVFNYAKNLKFHHIAMIFDKYSTKYAVQNEDETPQNKVTSPLSIVLRKSMAKYFLPWRREHMKQFILFLNEFNEDYLNKLSFVGGNQFEIDKKSKFESLYNKETIDKINNIYGQPILKKPIKNFDVYSVDIDCHIFVNDSDSDDFNRKIKSFYKEYTKFVEKETIKYLSTIADYVQIESNKQVWRVEQNIKQFISYKLKYALSPDNVIYYPQAITKGDVHPVYTWIDDNYYKLNHGVVNHELSRPYLLIRETIALRNDSCAFYKEPNIFELNMISKTRLMKLYNYWNNYNQNNSLDDYNASRKPLFFFYVFIQKLCYDNNMKAQNKKLNTTHESSIDIINKRPNSDITMKNMLYSAWINYKVGTKPKMNHYRFVHYAVYFIKKILYIEYVIEFNTKLKEFFGPLNEKYYEYYKMPEILQIQNDIDICNNYSSKDLLEETEKDFTCITQVAFDENVMEFEYSNDDIIKYYNKIEEQKEFPLNDNIDDYLSNMLNKIKLSHDKEDMVIDDDQEERKSDDYDDIDEDLEERKSYDYDEDLEDIDERKIIIKHDARERVSDEDSDEDSDDELLALMRSSLSSSSSSSNRPQCNIKGLKYIHNSCYIDSVLVSIFAIQNDFIEKNILELRDSDIKNIIMKKTKSENPSNPRISRFEQDYEMEETDEKKEQNVEYICGNNLNEDMRNRKAILTELRKITNSLRNVSNTHVEKCTNLRNLLSKCKSQQQFHLTGMQDSGEFLRYIFELFNVGKAKRKEYTFRYNNPFLLKDDILKTTVTNDDVIVRMNEPVDNIYTIAPAMMKNNSDIQSYINIDIEKDVTVGSSNSKMIELYQIIDAEYLVIQLDRRFTDESLRSSRNKKKIVPNENISLVDGTILELHSIVVHYKNHYTCYLKCNGNWFYYDDMENTFEYIGDYDEMIDNKRYPSPVKKNTLCFYSVPKNN